MELINSVESKIYYIRGISVMLDSDLAVLYEVETKRINEQVKRNEDRFPCDFMFQLTKEELENLKSQNATSSWGGRRKLPYAFTEHGVLMLSSVLNSERAIAVNIQLDIEAGNVAWRVPYFNEDPAPGCEVDGWTFSLDD